LPSKKEEATCIGNAVVRHPVDGNSGENPKRFNGKRARPSSKRKSKTGKRARFIEEKITDFFDSPNGHYLFCNKN
jgi:hypothetical protein